MGNFSWISVFLSLFLICHAEETISRTRSIEDGQTLVSPDNTFELGFFSPDNSSFRYLGIWYTRIPKQTVVWIANREKPISDSSGVLTIHEDGNLVLLNAGRSLVWSTNLSEIPWNNTVAKLLDNGNLVMTGGNFSNGGTAGRDVVLWQSFDHPTDTLLPGMRIGFNEKTHQNRLLVSWNDNSNPSPGNFSYGLNPQDSYQFFIWNQSVRYWRSGRWNGRTFNLLAEGGPSFMFHFAIQKNEEGAFFQYSSLYNNTRLVMDVSGRLMCNVWYDTSQTWGVVWSQPKDDCAVYNICGLNSVCSEFKSPLCECIIGFEPVSPAEWDSGYWKSGCKRKRRSDCGIRDDFFSLGALKVPDNEVAAEAETEADCRERCAANCSCSAFSFTDAGSNVSSKCLNWFGNLTDAGDLKEQWGQNLHIRLTEAELRSDKRRSLLLIVPVSVISGILFLGVAYCCFRKLNVKKGGKDGVFFSVFSVNQTETAPMTKEVMGSKSFNAEAKERLDLPSFTFGTVAIATNHFSDSNLLGQGGFGDVYWGKLPGGQEIAAKRLSINSGQGVEELINEVTLIAKLQHRNLVRLLGYCIERDEKLLLYEYMNNKSLDTFLFDPERRKLLDWEKRFNIILGVARGLVYLHQDSRLRIIHRDLKTSNILLDTDMNPKISDFGMARIFGGNQTQGNTRRVVGTYGYMSPEYALDGFFSTKSDVFSFGVILLEVVSGKKNNNFYGPESSLSLLGYAWELWREGRGMELMDPSVRESADEKKVLKCIELGLLCVQEDPAERPTMASITAVLVGEGETACVPVPKRPASYVRKYLAEEGDASRNEITISLRDGR
ncbi:G-type lectin S-receptor-like serine/threonine-protein kinase At4g03230 [Aristolochia californica]|uniref:G-type lectin S-receptor-like serine/threonine-protein kinase At4g03230 n=1 Tax=Aristolochia californica TaxID=171875 RepID=UPI0035DA3B1D